MKLSPVLDKITIIILLVIFGGVVLHAPFSVALTTLLPGGELFWKSWKEILLGAALILTVISISTKKQWRSALSDRLIQISAAYAALHILLLPFFSVGVLATLSGILIDLRYVLFFVLVYLLVRNHPKLRRPFLIVGLTGAGIVALFGVLQATVLPHDVLKYIGYGQSTIAPYLTVDQNYDFVRINSTLRGPNPLGAFGAIAAAAALAFLIASWTRLGKWYRFGLIALIAGASVVVWFSFSRSGLIALAAALFIVLAITLTRRHAKAFWITCSALAVVGLIGLSLISQTAFFKNVVLHEDPNEAGLVNSNDGHTESLIDGTNRMLAQPFGAGVGSTGSASLYSEQPVIIENQYLFIAHESGWLGLLLFVALFGLILVKLWQRRTEWLASAVFASGIGMAIIGLVLPVWVDDTVSIVWWGLAAVALAAERVKHGIRKSN